MFCVSFAGFLVIVTLHLNKTKNNKFFFVLCSVCCNFALMKLHIFNPEHDIALAADMERFTAPHAGRHMRASLGFLPAFWATDGDIVLVDEVEAALEAVRHMKSYAHDVMFVTVDDLRHMDDALVGDISSVEPWGWDKTLCFQLAKANPGLARLLPSAETLAKIREMSSRRFAATNLLPQLVALDPKRLVGESRYCSSADEVLALLQANGRSVVKAPWSCSGRGVRYVGDALDDHAQGWLLNIIRQQGGVTVEPLYNKVYDFGLEFFAEPSGNIRYCGLSLFDTSNCAYCGSILATEADKRDMLSQYVDLQLLDRVRDGVIEILAPHFAGVYTGPFGIDMMAVVGSGPVAGHVSSSCGFLLHPFVELNLRRTMGHVALALSPNEYEPRKVMRISFNGGKYRMRVTTTAENLLNTGLV